MANKVGKIRLDRNAELILLPIQLLLMLALSIKAHAKPEYQTVKVEKQKVGVIWRSYRDKNYRYEGSSSPIGTVLKIDVNGDGYADRIATKSRDIRIVQSELRYGSFQKMEIQRFDRHHVTESRFLRNRSGKFELWSVKRGPNQQLHSLDVDAHQSSNGNDASQCSLHEPSSAISEDLGFDALEEAIENDSISAVSPDLGEKCGEQAELIRKTIRNLLNEKTSPFLSCLSSIPATRTQVAELDSLVLQRLSEQSSRPLVTCADIDQGKGRYNKSESTIIIDKKWLSSKPAEDDIQAVLRHELIHHIVKDDDETSTISECCSGSAESESQTCKIAKAIHPKDDFSINPEDARIRSVLTEGKADLKTKLKSAIDSISKQNRDELKDCTVEANQSKCKIQLTSSYQAIADKVHAICRESLEDLVCTSLVDDFRKAEERTVNECFAVATCALMRSNSSQAVEVAADSAEKVAQQTSGQPADASSSEMTITPGSITERRDAIRLAKQSQSAMQIMMAEAKEATDRIDREILPRAYASESPRRRVSAAERAEDIADLKEAAKASKPSASSASYAGGKEFSSKVAGFNNDGSPRLKINGVDLKGFKAFGGVKLEESTGSNLTAVSPQGSVGPSAVPMIKKLPGASGRASAGSAGGAVGGLSGGGGGGSQMASLGSRGGSRAPTTSGNDSAKDLVKPACEGLAEGATDASKLKVGSMKDLSCVLKASQNPEATLREPWMRKHLEELGVQVVDSSNTAIGPTSAKKRMSIKAIMERN